MQPEQEMRASVQGAHGSPVCNFPVQIGSLVQVPETAVVTILRPGEPGRQVAPRRTEEPAVGDVRDLAAAVTDWTEAT